MWKASRRTFLGLLPALGAPAQGRGLDRQAVVRRHDPIVRSIDDRSPLSVGNGELAFTVDVTGLQSLPGSYKTIPLCTQSQWGWHSFPMPEGMGSRTLKLEMFDTHGREVPYATSARGQQDLFNWLRENPHRLNLMRAGLVWKGQALQPADITEIDQRLNLWEGVIISRFRLRDQPVEVETCCHPREDILAFAVKSPIEGLAIAIDFPYGSPGMDASDWNAPGKHTTRLDGRRVSRHIGGSYFVDLSTDGALRFEAPHRIVIEPRRNTIEVACRLSPNTPPNLSMTATEVRRASSSHWQRFWQSGGAVDFSGSTDERAKELERRVVLSQYLTAIQCAGSMPPQETGLTCNSWYGKFHLEMHWWHAAHFPMWGRPQMLERSMAFYQKILPGARGKAKLQGYAGARWPKMVGPDGHDSPSAIGPLLIWQQPHPIAMAELLYQSRPDRRTLDRYAPIVMESAEFMASFAYLNPGTGQYDLGPPVIPAQENHPPRETWNPTFELEYWHHALGLAQEWRKRLGLPAVSKWEDVRSKLAPSPVKDGVYLAHENCPQTYTERNRDHPSMLAALGVLPGARVDRGTMQRTIDKTMKEWRWADTWGWDFPMVAMTAARLKNPSLAIDALFIESPKNTWLPNGHNWQRDNLPLYLPGNGGLLAAIAVMANTGFQVPGWSMKTEGLRDLISA